MATVIPSGKMLPVTTVRLAGESPRMAAPSPKSPTSPSRTQPPTSASPTALPLRVIRRVVGSGTTTDSVRLQTPGADAMAKDPSGSLRLSTPISATPTVLWPGTPTPLPVPYRSALSFGVSPSPSGPHSPTETSERGMEASPAPSPTTRAPVIVQVRTQPQSPDSPLLQPTNLQLQLSQPQQQQQPQALQMQSLPQQVMYPYHPQMAVPMLPPHMSHMTHPMSMMMQQHQQQQHHHQQQQQPGMKARQMQPPSLQVSSPNGTVYDTSNQMQSCQSVLPGQPFAQQQQQQQQHLSPQQPQQALTHTVTVTAQTTVATSNEGRQLVPSPTKVGGPSTGPLPSAGSMLHDGTGRCSPCAWFWKPRGCQSGASCGYCHLCPEGELKTRKKTKVAAIKAGIIQPANPKPAAVQHIKLNKLL